MTGEPVVSSGPVSPVDRLDLAAIEADAASWAEVMRRSTPTFGIEIVALRNRLCVDVPALVAEVKRLRYENENLRVRVEMRRPLCRCQPPSCTERDEARAAVERVRALHRPSPESAPDAGHCVGCGGDHLWPCPTIRALDGAT